MASLFFAFLLYCSRYHGDLAADQIVRGPSGGCHGDLISAPDSGYFRVFDKSFLVGNFVLADVLKSQDLKLCFGAKSFVLGQKLAKLGKEEDL